MNIVVLAGGNSTEREVSLVSGKGVYNALKSKGHNVVLLDVYFGIENVNVDSVFEDTRDWSEGINAVKEVNGEIVSLGELSTLCKKLVDIHGQYDHQSLLNPDNHINILDLFL